MEFIRGTRNSETWKVLEGLRKNTKDKVQFPFITEKLTEERRTHTKKRGRNRSSIRGSEEEHKAYEE